jgi:hypothetical protein
MEIVNQIDINNSLWFLLKTASIIGLIIYVIFAFVVMKQVSLMTATLELDFEKPIKIVATLHFVFAIFVLIYAFFV